MAFSVDICTMHIYIDVWVAIIQETAIQNLLTHTESSWKPQTASISMQTHFSAETKVNKLLLYEVIVFVFYCKVMYRVDTIDQFLGQIIGSKASFNQSRWESPAIRYMNWRKIQKCTMWHDSATYRSRYAVQSTIFFLLLRQENQKIY